MGKGPEKTYDLEERTAKFGEAVIEFALDIPVTAVKKPLIEQLVKAGTSVGANYCEADDAESDNDFIHKISICCKEAHETKHWLRMIAKAQPDLKPQTRKLWKEIRELHLIFVTIIRNVKKRSQRET